MDRLQIDRWLESMKMRRSLQWRSSRSWINLSDEIPSHRDSKKSCWSLFKWASWRGILKNSRKASEKKKFVTSQGLRRLMQNISRCSWRLSSHSQVHERERGRRSHLQNAFLMKKAQELTTLKIVYANAFEGETNLKCKRVAKLSSRGKANVMQFSLVKSEVP